jgi:hypothetical protein
MIEAAVVALACGRPVTRVPVALPAPIVARTACGTYAIGTDGKVAPYRRNWAPAWAPHASARAAPGVWVAHPHGRLALYRAGRLLWRSAIRIASDEVTFHDGAIAIGVYGRYAQGPTLWMARVGVHEFPVAESEEPIGWTAGGLVTQHENRIRVRAADGSLRRGLGYGHSSAYDGANRTVVFVTHYGAIVRTDGRHIWRLARVRPSSWVTVLGNRMLQVTTGRRSLFLRSDGSRVGTADAVNAAVGLPKQRGVVYVTTRGRETRAGVAVAGTNVVYELDASGRTRRLYSHRVPFLSCGEAGGVSYAAGWVLYTDSEGPAAVLDLGGRRAPLDLTPVLRVLQPRRALRAQLYADWLSSWR